jgi:hemoglobin
MSESSTDQTLFTKLGGEGAIRAVVDAFYERVLGDPDLAPYFADVDMATLRRHQFEMIASATGGPVTYTGRDMAAAHAGKNITSADFDKVVGHLVATLQSLGVDDDSIGQVGAVLLPLKPEIVAA